MAELPHDVFISYASPDKLKAFAACHELEQAGIRCWIAPRDILPGSPWTASIMDAIGQARIMVLVFSSNANLSTHVLNEVERAVSKGYVVIPLRVEDVTPSGGFELLLSNTHWLDAFP